MTPVFLTIDTELAWRHHAAGLDEDTLFARSLDPADVGVGYQLASLKRHGLKACFFVDPMPALAFGLQRIRRLVGTVLDAGQEVQLHCHPNWSGAHAGDGGASWARFDLVEYDLAEQRALIGGAGDLLCAAGAPDPVAFRAGSYAGNDDTLTALAGLGIRYDSSHNGAEPPELGGIGLPARQIAPVVHRDVIEVPVTVIEDRPGTLRTAQVCALSAGEMSAAIDHAIGSDHAALTVVNHCFELANRAGTRANAIHLARFEGLCATLADHRAVLPTVQFRDRPALVLNAADAPLAPSLLRTGWRHAEQLWSNLVEERAA